MFVGDWDKAADIGLPLSDDMSLSSASGFAGGQRLHACQGGEDCVQVSSAAALL